MTMGLNRRWTLSTTNDCRRPDLMISAAWRQELA